MATTSPRRIHRRYVREKATIDHLVKECYEAKAPERRVHSSRTESGQSAKNRFAKSGARVRVDCQSSEPAFVKLLISADLQSTRQAGSSRLLPSRSIL